MAKLFADGFDWLSVPADITLRWDAGAISAVIPAAGTAFGVGGAVTINGSVNLIKSWGSNEGTLYANIRRRQTGGTLATNYHYLTFQEAAGNQCTIRWNEDGSLAAYSGSATGTPLATVGGAHSSLTWDSWQIKVVIHATAGSVEVRKNGSTTPILLVTGVNTRLGTANAYANKLTLGASAGASSGQFDDVFLNSGAGAAPNGWPGDLRAYTNAPNAAVSTQFTPSMTTTTFGQTVTGSVLLRGANTLCLTRLIAGQSGAVTQLAINGTAALTGHVKAALYADANGVAGALLAVSSELTNPAAGINIVTFAAPASVMRGQPFWVAHHQDVTWSSRSSAAGTTGFGGSISAPYAGGFPATAPDVSPAALSDPYNLCTVTGIPQVSMVADAGQDGDASYVFSSTVGQKDLYAFPAMPINPASIVGVEAFCIARKTDAGTREVQVKAKSGLTEVAAATNGALPQTYAFVSGFLANDPATGDLWTTAKVNALVIGPEITG